MKDARAARLAVIVPIFKANGFGNCYTNGVWKELSLDACAGVVALALVTVRRWPLQGPLRENET